MLPTILTAVIGLVAKGPAAKAIAATIPGAISGLFLGPEVIAAFQQGVTDAGAIPLAHQIGMLVGGAVFGGINFVITYFAPKNKEK